MFIDGGNLLHRCYHVSKKTPLTNSKGQDVGIIKYFLQNIKNMQDMFHCDRIFVAWDLRDKNFTNFRQEGVEYKEHRDKSKDKEVHRCDKIIWALCENLGIQNMRAYKLEADDIIYFLCDKYKKDENIIVSSDKDFLQLFNHFYDLKIYSPIKKCIIDMENLLEFTEGVTIDRYLLYRSIVGDSSDNIKGIYGLGPKRAKVIVENYKEKLRTLKEGDKNIIKENMKIMDLRRGIEEYPDEAEYYESQIGEKKSNFKKFMNYIKKLEIYSIMNSEGDWNSSFFSDDGFDELKNFLEG